jgi:hypothetical protein
VETFALPLEVGLEVIRTDTRKMRVLARSIVEGLNVVRNIFRRERAIFVDVLLDELFLQTAEKRFRYSIVPAIAFATHARLKMVGFTKTPPGVASVL